MTSTIEVAEKTVNNREVISFTKEYADEEHEVFCPKEQGTQLVFNLLSVVNAEKDDEDRFVLVRKGDVGYMDREATGDTQRPKMEALSTVVEALYDSKTAKDVIKAIEGDTNE